MVSENARRLREEKRLTLDEAARLTGVSRSMLAQIEKGDMNPTISMVWKIANGYKVSFTSLVEPARERPPRRRTGGPAPSAGDGGVCDRLRRGGGDRPAGGDLPAPDRRLPALPGGPAPPLPEPGDGGDSTQYADLVQALKNQPGPDGPGWGIFQERGPGHRLRRPHRKPRENSTASISRESALAAKVSGGPQL